MTSTDATVRRFSIQLDFVGGHSSPGFIAAAATVATPSPALAATIARHHVRRVGCVVVLGNDIPVRLGDGPAVVESFDFPVVGRGFVLDLFCGEGWRF